MKKKGIILLFIGLVIATVGASDFFSFIIIDGFIKHLIHTNINFNTLDVTMRIATLGFGFLYFPHRFII